jgi:hypothetical protein
MNIFVTNEDPVLAARDLCDKHCRSKMQIESAIMLAHAFNQEVLNHPSTPRTQTGKPRKSGKGYFNHQCTAWVRESRANFDWLVAHAQEMFTERTFRWPDSNEHFTRTFIDWCAANAHNTNVPIKGLTPFAVAISSDSECRKLPHFEELSTVDKYRAYIIHDKDFAIWTRRESPEWFNSLPQYDHLRYASIQYQSTHLAA